MIQISFNGKPPRTYGITTYGSWQRIMPQLREAFGCDESEKIVCLNVDEKGITAILEKE